jgi:hypothetical protein
MRTAWIVNLLLLAGVVGLAFYAVYRPNPQDNAPQFKLSELAPAAVEVVRIEPQGSTPIALERRGERWYMTQPLEARADQSQVQRVLDVLSAKAKDKLPATDLGRFDLAQPVMRVSFDDQTLSFGTVNPLTQEQYVLAGDSVYLLPALYTSLPPSRPDRLLTHALLRDEETPVAFALKAFKLELKDDKWAVSPPAGNEAPSQDDLNRWVDGWRHASSLVTRPASNKAPAETIHVRLSDGRTLALGVISKDPDLILLRPDEGLEFQFSSDLGQRLLSRPEAPTPSPSAAPPATSESDPR